MIIDRKRFIYGVGSRAIRGSITEHSIPVRHLDERRDTVYNARSGDFITTGDTREAAIEKLYISMAILRAP